jgi:hypothetical protein
VQQANALYSRRQQLHLGAQFADSVRICER